MLKKSPLTSNLYAVLFCIFSMPAMAQGLHSLKITTENGNEVTLAVEDLDELTQSEFSTSTIWTEGVIDFSGVSLFNLLKSLDISGERVELTALNDYAITMSISDLEENVPLIATRMDGETMSVRDKGPFWMVFPYDSDRRFRTEATYARSIWQLNRISIVE